MVESVIEVEVVYAAADRQVLLTVAVPDGASVREALRKSAVGAQFPELDLGTARWVYSARSLSTPMCIRFMRVIGSRFTGHCWWIPRRFVACVPPRQPRPKRGISDSLNARQ